MRVGTVLPQALKHYSIGMQATSSRICRAIRRTKRLRILALVSSTTEDGKQLLELTLEEPLGQQRGTRVPVGLAGFGVARLDRQRKTRTISPDRRGLTFDAPKGLSRSELQRLGRDIADGSLSPAVTSWWEKAPASEQSMSALHLHLDPSGIEVSELAADGRPLQQLSCQEGGTVLQQLSSMLGKAACPVPCLCTRMALILGTMQKVPSCQPPRLDRLSTTRLPPQLSSW
jgi:hypothetical protein